MAGALSVDAGAAVVACFGEVLLRFSPPGGTALRDARELAVHVGGAEANVAVALSNLGLATRMISTLPESDLGTLAMKALRAERVDCSRLARGPGRMGSYFLTPAAGPQAGSVLYDREGSAFALTRNYDESALDGATHLHLSGISLAVSEAAAQATIAMARAARARGMTVSVDANYRASLWQRAGRDARPAIADLVEQADLFFGNHRDAALLLDRDFDGEGSARRRLAAQALFDRFTNLSAIASTARHVEPDGSHTIVARVDGRETFAEAAPRVLTNIVDRIGTGDAFAAGVLSGWLAAPADLPEAAERGVTLAQLKHYAEGDFTRTSAAEVAAAMQGAADVAR
ncbi:sugar kinase [Aurantiacibacter luteus]|uniref:Carbohydrate kinase PfkB domain-containing protein n=1 Tax=Aurantiacibacter luteus TaxID=1581420 RepID=A0A0G9MNT7_9SPHN|nr:sugar kinase [Aurantiacibacter luteus]KLE32386.1 hypothetical protein AAW00_13145 [Aurantiacibacter luteus]